MTARPGSARLATRLTVALLALTAIATPADARSCYQEPSARSIARIAPPVAQREVLFLIDQTVPYPEHVRQHVIAQMSRLAVGGTIISVGTFSSYSGHTYLHLHASQFFEPSVPRDKEDEISMRGLRRLRTCLRETQESGVRAGQRLLTALFRLSRPSITQSDIMSSLRRFGTHVRASRAPRRIIVLVSDMLENSSTTSFYRRGRLGLIDPGAELRKAGAANLFADLGGARVFVIGAGLSASGSAATVPDSWTQALERFWGAYLARSRASLEDFGTPTLMRPIN